jgi:hypothetical protein
MAFDRATSEVVLFGGGDRVSLGDTWTWGGERWQQKHPAHRPPARQHAAMAYDAERRQVLLFGGDSEEGSGRPELRADTWAWDGSDWTQLHPVSSPNAGPTPHMAYDATAREVVLVTQPEGWSLMDASSATRTWT